MPAKLIWLALLILPLLQTTAPPTDQTAQPAFEVASIKKHVPDPSGRMMVGMGSPPGDVSRWSATNVTARNLVSYAYSLKDFQLSGGPNWMNTERFDVDAKVDDSLVPQLQKLTHQEQQKQMALMLRSLLADRLKLQVSHATKDAPAFALVVAKGGPKLKEAPPPDPKVKTGYSMSAGPNGATLTMDGRPISDLTSLLSAILRKPVVDQTGLKGTYAFTLQYSGAEASADNGPPSIFTALQEQLGLRLENTTAPVDMVTIEHIEEPSEN